MVGTIVHQLTRNLTEEQIREAGFAPYFVDHTAGVFPQFASGTPWSAGTMQVTGDTIADLTEDLAAEQKARVTYDNILRLSDDPDVSDVIKFLRAREVVHFQRFGESQSASFLLGFNYDDIQSIPTTPCNTHGGLISNTWQGACIEAYAIAQMRVGKES